MITDLANDLKARRDGEAPEAHAKRLSDTQRLFRNVFADPDGIQLVQLLVTYLRPLQPRFIGNRTPEEAAFRDGQCNVLNAILDLGTDLLVAKSDQP